MSQSRFRKRKPGRRVNATGRSIGGDGHHVRFYQWELKSPAYRSLSLGARALLIELKSLYNGSNNGDLFLSVREAARRLNCGKNLYWALGLPWSASGPHRRSAVA